MQQNEDILQVGIRSASYGGSKQPMSFDLGSWSNKHSNLAWSPWDHETLSKVY